MKEGRLEQVGDRWQLHFTRRLPHPPEKVWRALTEPEHLKEWFPNDIEGERKEGATLRHVFRNDEAPVMTGEMLRFEPPAVLEFTWGDDLLRFELRGEDNDSTTVLELVDVLEDIGKGARDGAGWHVCLDALEQHLEGKATDTQNTDVWKPVHEKYVAEFPPEASTIGVPESKNSV
jgi:uncharacterized protein YndB with AHSA1/START domain